MLPSSSPESIRSVGIHRLWIDAPTRADWCDGLVELTTALDIRRVNEATAPPHS
jgi:hypothetical protein